MPTKETRQAAGTSYQPSFLHALPVYLGSKRRLAPLIFREIERAGCPSARGLVLADAFLGGGSIGLLGKVLGYRVVANDVAAHSEALGKALIENGRFTLSDEDVALAYATEPTGWWLPEVKKLPFPEEIRLMLASLTKGAETFSQPEKRALLRALVFKTAVRIAMWGQVRATVGKNVREQRWDVIPPSQQRALGPFLRPRRELIVMANSLNHGVFSNGLQNEMHRSDAIEFLRGVEADVAYLDPPYPGTVAYEDQYGGVDEILEGRELSGERSRFSAREGWRYLGEVFDAAEKIPVWVLSLGNEVVGLEPLVAMMEERGRTVEATTVRYEHLRAQASATKRAENLEYVITAKAKVPVPA